MKKYIITVYCILLMCSCTPDGIFDIGYGIRGGYYDGDTDFAFGSHVSRAKANAAWKECSDKYMRNGGSVLVEQCMNDKGLIRLSEIRRRQKRAEQKHKEQ